MSGRRGIEKTGSTEYDYSSCSESDEPGPAPQIPQANTPRLAWLFPVSASRLPNRIRPLICGFSSSVAEVSTLR